MIITPGQENDFHIIPWASIGISLFIAINAVVWIAKKGHHDSYLCLRIPSVVVGIRDGTNNIILFIDVQRIYEG